MMKNKTGRNKKSFAVGTRGSRLALLQAEEITGKLRERFSAFEFTVKVISTKGDRITDRSLAAIGGKGLFVKEIEDALLKGEIDIAVHSMKDMPAELPEGLKIASITKRLDPHDALISRGNQRLSELPAGAMIGTSSLRRKSQILNFRPDLTAVDLRGNLDTRLRKLADGNFDAIVAAAAGLERMNLKGAITEIIPFEICLPAAGQGALCIETRSGDAQTCELAGTLNDEETNVTVTAERSMLKKLQGGCQVPIGAYGRVEKGKLVLDGLVAGVDGKKVIRGNIAGSPEKAEELGIKLAESLIERGADEILKSAG